MVQKNAKLGRKVFKHEAMVVRLFQIPHLLLNQEKKKKLDEHDCKNNK